MSKKYLLKDLKALCKEHNIKCRGNKQEIYDKLVSERVISVNISKASPFKGNIPVDALIEIALQTSDYTNVIEQCRVDKAMAKRCNTQFWNKWIKIHNPEVFMVLDTPRDIVYNQLFLTPEKLYEKMRKEVLNKTITKIYDIRNEEITVQKFTSRDPEISIKKRIDKLSISIPNLDHLNIFKFRPISDILEFYIVVSSDVETAHMKTTLIGTYRTKEELEPVMDEYAEEFEVGDMWWIKINMDKFKIGELTTQLPTEIKIEISDPA